MDSIISRHYAPILAERLKSFPVVTVLGPRQCGKTTMVTHELADWKYLDLERPSDLATIADDPEFFLNQNPRKVVFDEAQRLPKLFEVLRSTVDARRKENGRFVLLGSASPQLIQEITESLAGRVSFIELTPFLWPEISKHVNFPSFWLRGGFPDACLLEDDAKRFDWYEAFTRTFIEQDLRALGLDFSATQMRRLWTMLAHFHGQTWNASQLASSLGVSYHTVNRYTDILEQTFLVRKLKTYLANIKKRLVKSPKIYLRDPGVLHYFLSIHDQDTLYNHPKRGASWEGLAIEQLQALLRLQLPQTNFYYWRTIKGVEVDLLIQFGAKLVAFEIKLHSAPTGVDGTALASCMADLNIARGFILHSGENTYSVGKGIRAMPLVQVLSLDREELLALLDA